MNLIKQHYNNIIKYNFINKCNFAVASDIPKIKKIVISFNFVNYSKKKVLCCLLVFKLLTGYKGVILKSKTHNLKLKIKKGAPVACVVVLNNKSQSVFMETLIYHFLPNLNLKKVEIKNKNSFSFRIPKIFFINEYNKHYIFFKDLLDLNITLVSTTKNISDFLFLLKSFNIKVLP